MAADVALPPKAAVDARQLLQLQPAAAGLTQASGPAGHTARNMGMLHHVELYVSDLGRSCAFWTPLMALLGYDAEPWSGGMSYVRGEEETYICLLPAPAEHLAAGYHRKRVGLNHLAFRGQSRAQVDQIARWVKDSGHTLLYEDRHPFAGGPTYYAVFFEDPDRFKLEVVAPREA